MLALTSGRNARAVGMVMYAVSMVWDSEQGVQNDKCACWPWY